MQRRLVLVLGGPLVLWGCAAPKPSAPCCTPPAARTPAPAPTPAPPRVESPPSAAAKAQTPRSFRETLADLLQRARSGADPALAGHVELLETIERIAPTAGTETVVARDAAREREMVASHGRGTALASVVSFFEPGGDAAAMRRVFLDLDRSGEITGKPGTRLVSRSGSVLLGETDATRKVLWLTYSARWRYEIREIDRGDALLWVSTMTPWEGAAGVLDSRALFLAVPVAGGVHVAHVAFTCVDFSVPAIAKGAANTMAEREVRDRTEGLRAHWREYVGK